MQKHLCAEMKFRIYQTCFLPVLAGWVTNPDTPAGRLGAARGISCVQSIKWFDFVTVLQRSGLPLVVRHGQKRHSLFFRHAAGMDVNTPALRALKLSTSVRWGGYPDPSWATCRAAPEIHGFVGLSQIWELRYTVLGAVPSLAVTSTVWCNGP